MKYAQKYVKLNQLNRITVLLGRQFATKTNDLRYSVEIVRRITHILYKYHLTNIAGTISNLAKSHISRI